MSATALLRGASKPCGRILHDHSCNIRVRRQGGAARPAGWIIFQCLENWALIFPNIGNFAAPFFQTLENISDRQTGGQGFLRRAIAFLDQFLRTMEFQELDVPDPGPEEQVGRLRLQPGRRNL